MGLVLTTQVGHLKVKLQNHLMIIFAKSVPFCKEGQKLVTQISDFFIKKNSICYEIGCSTGTLTKMISLRHKEKKQAKFIGIDIESDMIRYAKKNNKLKNVKFILGNANKIKFQKADLIVAYYSMQFIRPSDRQNYLIKFLKL